ncbi:transglycosylase domain-containing protein [Pectobacterium atrosepticum]|uniref:transglycosylase domain-containing protein n=2 Tax=Pectobacterium TaxID=122277 RepID=UPI00130536B3|nr:transglycosylase domain-containing protein [Pectobacterium atrosepticum]MBL0895400.1 transglycosylase domain-containing protein [Pectobacterium atrosepticum]MCA6979704.1 transglycosylase domain-containing protein [Pectobacterium atrosepticum]MCH5020885.1 transglycosylase domain-containing protein [Pectobacterium atrosepticum]MDK9442795.1 transglycosylase domain-containing protein [Pectobacterium atrosepticum]
MSRFKIYRTSFALFTIPIFTIIFLLKLVNYKPLIKDLKKCLTYIHATQGNENSSITNQLIKALVISEDHRNSLHFGVDLLAILRVIKLRILYGKYQGASTIEQQFVRTITQRYERTLRRKIREQVLAVMLNQLVPKNIISISYLSCAYYGSGMIGTLGIEKIKSDSVDFFESKCIAYLKYPKPIIADSNHSKKHTARYKHIENLLLKNFL